MRYVQYWPPEVEPVPDSGAVKPKWRVTAVRKVAERILPPMIYRPPAETPALPAIARRRMPRPQAVDNERRKFCRRINHEASVLEELRAGIERRRRNQRRGDMTTAIDEKI